MMKLKLSSLALIIVMLAFCGAGFGNQMWLPSGTQYVAPEGGTLVLSQDFGSASGRDGAGSWVLGGNASIVEHQDYITIGFEAGDAGTATINLGFSPRLSDYVIDIGLIDWQRLGGQTAYNAVWQINSYGSGSGMVHQWIARDNDVEAIQTSETMPYEQGTEYVIRFSNPEVSNNPSMTLNLGGEDNSITEGSQWGQSGDNNADFFRLRAATTGASLNNIAWIRIYEGVSTSDAALVPEPMTLALLGIGGLFIRRRKK